MGENVIADQLRSVFETAVSNADKCHLLTPAHRYVDAFINFTAECDQPVPETRLLARRSVLQSLMDDFILASNAADLIAEDTLAIRGYDRPIETSLLVSDRRVISLVSTTDKHAGLTSDDPELVAEAVQTCQSRWELAEPVSTPAPPLSTVEETLAERINPDTKQDFKRILDVLDTARGNGDGLDEVTVSLLAAANNEVLLYDISRWGEDIGIASKATFSRTKSQLEDVGIIQTEKVPIDVGRPRLRLKLAVESPSSPAALAETTRTALQTAD